MNIDIGFDETQYGKLAKSTFTHLTQRQNALPIGIDAARNNGMALSVRTYPTLLLTVYTHTFKTDCFLNPFDNQDFSFV